LQPIALVQVVAALAFFIHHHTLFMIHIAGADPTAALQRFGDRKGWPMGSRLHLISLGQGQGPLAESIVKHAAGVGDWVCLQNCHLAESWMTRLEEKVRAMIRERIHTCHCLLRCCNVRPAVPAVLDSLTTERLSSDRPLARGSAAK
jgi:hypothetical protein